MSSEKYSTDAIQNMILGIRSKDHNTRSNSLANLHIIAKVLGPDRTRNELIPYTIETTDHNCNELSIIATQLGLLFQDIGGPANIKVLLDALRTLCEIEDILVREPATESIISIGQQINKNNYTPIEELAKDLCQDQWYPLRCSGACVCCRLYKNFPEKVIKDINQEIISLASDPIIMVRCSLAKNVPVLIKAGATQLASTILPTLAKDDSAAVAIEVPVSLSLIAPTNYDLALKASETIYKTDIWQAKSVLISYIDSIFKDKPPKDFLKQIISTAQVDQENVIRASIARQIPFIYKSGCIPFDQFQQFVMSLISDSENCIRIAVAEALGRTPATKSSFDENSLTALLSDEELEVRMEALKSVAISGKAISSAAKNLKDLITLSNWRIRKGVVSLLPKIANIYDQKKFNSEMLPILKSLLNDEASHVRNEATGILVDLVKKYGDKWEKSSLFPLINDLAASSDYMLRKTAIEAITAISCFDQFSAVLENLSKDSVPNVRMVLARSLPRNSSLLEKLKNDVDQDVKDCAAQR